MPMRHYLASGGQRVPGCPFPVANLRQILAVLIDVELVLYKFVLAQLLEIRALGPESRNAIDDILNQMEAIQIILHAHVECRGDGSFFLVAAHMDVAIGSAVGQAMHQPRVTMKAKDNVFVFGKQRIEIGFAQSVRMFAARLDFHQIDDIDHADLQVRQMLAQDGNGGQYLQRRCVATAGHHHIGF